MSMLTKVRGRVPWTGIRRIGARLTTPLDPDDYLALINPLWTARELRGRVEKVVKETDDAATIVIRPGWGWRYDHKPGQYVGIGLQIKGKFHWRSYSISSPPKHEGRTIAITVRAMPEGFISEHLVNGVAPGTIIRLALPSGDFVLPEPPPEQDALHRRRQRRHPGDVDAAHPRAPPAARPRRARHRDALQLPDAGPDDLRRRDPGPRRQVRQRHPAPAAHRHRRDARGLPARRPVPRLARARDLRLRPGRDARHAAASTSPRPTWRSSCTSSGSPSTSAATRTPAAASPSRTPARRSSATAPPPCWRRARRSASACRTAAGWASATPAR